MSERQQTERQIAVAHSKILRRRMTRLEFILADYKGRDPVMAAAERDALAYSLVLIQERLVAIDAGE